MGIVVRNGFKETLSFWGRVDLVNADLAAVGKQQSWLIQGAWNPGGVAGSASTHALGGVADFGDGTGGGNIEWYWRRRGDGGWRRGPRSVDGFDPHAHLFHRADLALMHPQLRYQVWAYDHGLNGLANQQRDTHPRPQGVPIWRSVRTAPLVHHVAAKRYPVYKSALRFGEHNESVRAMQIRLGITADGRFGPQTKAAIEGYCTRKGLPAYSESGSVSWRAYVSLFKWADTRFRRMSKP